MPPVIDKTFRLIDFNVCDAATETIDGQQKMMNDLMNSSSSSSSSSKSNKKTVRYVRNAKQFIIQMFGLNELGETCSIAITDYNPFFYVKVADNWTQEIANQFRDYLAQKIGMKGRDILDVSLVQKHKLYGFTNNKLFNFVKFEFRTQDAMNAVKNEWYKRVETEDVNTNARYTSTRRLGSLVYKGARTELYESGIPPILRYFHIKNISPSGWVRVKTGLAKRIDEEYYKTTTCKYEYICSMSAIEALNDKETRVPYKICSFDIEASSSHGDFPVPVKTYKRLATNIADVFIRQFQSQKLDSCMSQRLLQKILMAAFGFGQFDDVDLVYPKNAPERADMDYLIQRLISTAIKDAHMLDTSGEAAEKLSIMKSFCVAAAVAAGTAESGLDLDLDLDNDDDESDDEDAVVKNRRPTFGVEPTVNKSSTVIDVLCSAIYTRDQKINILDEMLTSCFPALKGDEVTFIGSTFMRYGESEPYLNHCVVAGTCDAVDGCVIESAASERDVLLKWTEVIQKENPDIIIGYNIFGFDYEFMFRRAQELGCAEQFLILSRRKGETCAKQKYQKKQTPDQSDEEEDVSSEPTTKLDIEHTTVQLASGEYDLKYPNIPGRLQIDMYAYFRRDFNLSSYKLDDVAGQFIGDDIKRIESVFDSSTGKQESWLFSSNLMGLHVGDFIHIEMTGFTSDYVMDGRKFPVERVIMGHEVEEFDKKKNAMVMAKYNIIVVSGEVVVDAGKSLKWGMAKDDVTPQDIFRLSKGSAADRAIVAKYCIQDCNLVHHLMNKIDVITGYVEMSRICSVPISFLVFRGQGIKLTSFVAKKCREKNTLMPDLDKSGSNEGYEGAIVLPPKCSMYMDNPVACVDYSSLYPSSMISNNLSHDSKVWTKEYDLEGRIVKETGERDPKTGLYIYDNLPGYEYIDIEFDTFRYVRKTPTSRAEKVKSGKMVCRWAQFEGDRKGIMPTILEELLKARSDTRKMAKTEKDPFMQNILDKRQLGYKVTANSLYGQCGAKTSTFYEKDVAASTTATGRSMITYARRIIEEVYGCRQYETESNGVVLTKAEYVYGDSVADYTPVYIKYQNKVHILTIDSLAEQFGLGGWFRCEELGRQEKEVCEMVPGVETWSDKGWTKLHRVIRHELAAHKKMVRILTGTGCVDVTDDHSLVRADGTEVSPKDVEVGEHLLHHTLLRESEESKILPRGFGSLSKITGPSRPGLSKTTGSLRPDLSSPDWQGGRSWSEFWQPKTMLDGAIYANYLMAHGQIARLYFDEQKRLIVNGTHTPSLEADTSRIKLMHNIPYEGYVYDLTTENHHFAAGVGNMIVHNTDSVFFTFNLEDPKTGEKIRGKKALEITIEIAQDAAHLCSKFLKPPMDLAYEKTLMPFVLLSKKRYVGMLYETDPNKGKLKYMGLSLKRRDSCDYLKDTYGGILNVIMSSQDETKNNITKAIEFLDKSITNLIDGVVPMDKLAITKALRSDYKNPQQIAHKVLADRIAKRDPGNKPKPGDRIKFVHVVHPDKKALQGEKIETPEFIINNKLKIDYTFYITNQLMKPLQQLLGLALEQIWESMGNKAMTIRTFKREMDALHKEFPDLEIFMKKREKECSKRIKALLFDKYLTRINNDQAGLRDIRSIFGSKAGK